LQNRSLLVFGARREREEAINFKILLCWKYILKRLTLKSFNLRANFQAKGHEPRKNLRNQKDEPKGRSFKEKDLQDLELTRSQKPMKPKGKL